VDSTCLELLVESRRESGRSLPVADSAQDREEFGALVLAFLRRLLAAIDAESAEGVRAGATSARGDEPAAILATQVSLAKRLPDYWQRFETIRAEFALPNAT
jgi:hypothetical protein